MVLLNPEIMTLPSFKPPALSLSIMGLNCSTVHGIGPPPISTYSTPSCFTARMARSLRSRPFTGAPILGVLGPSLGMPGPRFQVFSAAVDDSGTSAATEPAATPLMIFLREREELIFAPYEKLSGSNSLLVLTRLGHQLIKLAARHLQLVGVRIDPLREGCIFLC